MEHFILNDKPLGTNTSESKRLMQFYRQKVQKLETKVDDIDENRRITKTKQLKKV